MGNRWKSFVFAVNLESSKHVYLPSISCKWAIESMKVCIGVNKI